MAQAVSRRPLDAETRVRSRFSPCGICGGQSGTGLHNKPQRCDASVASAAGPLKKRQRLFTSLLLMALDQHFQFMLRAT